MVRTGEGGACYSGPPLRIAMWSGPRNVSTALMRSWENRPDTHVIDEPFYAYYLLATGVAHPGRDEVIEHHETDWRKVVQLLTGPIPDGKSIFYQKHMTHHMLPEIERGWFDRVTHCFLIRDPREVLLSLHRKTPNPPIEATGFPQQAAIFRDVCERTGATPPVIDARELLTDPEYVLRWLCSRLGIPFSDAMLHWPPGPRPTDGVWAKYWYDRVWQSTGFEPYRPRDGELPRRLLPVYRECLACYELLRAHAVRLPTDESS